jgi:hypothetical protein
MSEESSTLPWAWIFEDDGREIPQTTGKITDYRADAQKARGMLDKLKEVSKTTFYNLNVELTTLTANNQVLTDQCNDLKAEVIQCTKPDLQGHSLRELIPIVVSQTVLAHKENITTKSEIKRLILDDVHRYLLDRKALVAYLKENNIAADHIESLKIVLFNIPKAELLEAIEQLVG